MWQSRHIAVLAVFCLALVIGVADTAAQGIQDGGQLVAAGDRDLRSGNARGAVRQYSRAINSEQLSAAELPKVLARRAEAHRKAGRPAQAIADINGALWLKGLSKAEEARAYLNRSLAYKEVGRDDRARADLNRARKLNPKVSVDTPVAALSAPRRESPAPQTPLLRGAQSATPSGAASPGFVTTVQPTKPSPTTTASVPGLSVQMPSNQPSNVVTTTAIAAAESQRSEPAPAAEAPAPTGTVPAQAAPPAPRPPAAPQAAAPAPAPAAPAPQAAAPQPAAPAPSAPPQGWATSVDSEPSSAGRPANERRRSRRIGRFFSGLWGSSEKEKAQSGGDSAPPLASAGRNRSDAAQPQSQAKSAGQGRYRLQLAALRSENEAQAAWRRLAAQHRSLLDGREPMIEKTDLGTLGTVYRLQIGPFADKRESLRLCNSFKRSGVDCFLVTR